MEYLINLTLKEYSSVQRQMKIEADRLWQQGISQHEAGQFQAAIDSWQQALILYRGTCDSPNGDSFASREKEAGALGVLGLTYHLLGQYENAIEYSEQSLSIYREIGNKKRIAVCLTHLGLAYFFIEQYQKAIEYSEQSLPINQEIGNKAGMTVSLSNLGLAYYFLRQHQKAIEYFEQSLAHNREIDNKGGIANSLTNLGAAHSALRQYQKAIEYSQQSLPISREVGDRQGEAKALNNLGKAYYRLCEYQKAIEYSEQSLALNREIGNKEGIITALINLGDAYSALKQYHKAIEFYQQSLPIHREIGDSPNGDSFASRKEEAKTLDNLGKAYFSLGQYQKAIETYQLWLEILRQIGDQQWEANALDNLGAAYSALGHYQKAIEFYQQSLTIDREIDNQEGIAASLVNLGASYASLGQYYKEIDYSQQGLEIARQIGHREWETNALHNLGNAYSSLGQYQKAIEYFQQQLNLVRQTGHQQWEARAINHLGYAYSSLGQYQKAIDYFHQSLALSQEIDNKAGIAASLSDLSNTYSSLGQYQEALAYSHQSLSLYREIGNPQGEANALDNLGKAYEAIGQYQEANHCYQQFLAINREIGDKAIEYYQQSLATNWKMADKASISATLIDRGAAYTSVWGVDKANYFATKQCHKMIEYCQQGLEIARQIGNRQWEANALNNLGNAYSSLRGYKKAIEFYKLAIAVRESIRGDIKIEELKMSFVDGWIILYERLISLLWIQGRFEEAFHFVERSRARAFLDQIANKPHNFRTGADDSLLRQEQALKNEITALRAQLVNIRNRPSNELDTEVISSVKAQLITREKDYTNLLTQLKLQSPEIASLVSVDVASLDEIQSLLDADTTLVEYFVITNHFLPLTLAFIITRNSFQTATLNITQEDLTKKIEAFRRFASLKNSHPKSLQQLYEWLITPLKSLLNTSELAIVPHSVLHYLPFAALSSGNQYLCDDYTITTLPSASILRFLPQKRKPSKGTGNDGGMPLLALGNPTTTEPLPSLRFAEQEVNAIASLYNTQPLIGAAATESTVFSQAGNAEILHLAVHGEFNKHNPLFSTLYLAPDNQYDGRLEVHDIYTLDLTTATNLVVLSACQTQLGELSKGDEVVGLNRAFLYAGTPSVIATLWSVNDKVTGLLMERFYTHLRSGMAKAQALHIAQMEVRVEYPHPYYWAAFVLTGDGGR
ncbi:MAG TPA: tetratricopeptide repeat protein [Stenomitos sp.]